uniref:Syntrophin C-terminal PH domain-containing protein n=1 Tax=Glossina austeni TaxID=7395 RepID=A0A1A9VSN8_GLOAU
MSCIPVNAVKTAEKRKTFAVSHHGKSGGLTLDWQTGFSLAEGADSAIVWQYKFSQLRGSSDDGKSKLKLHFQDHETRAIETKISPRLETFFVTLVPVASQVTPLEYAAFESLVFTLKALPVPLRMMSMKNSSNTWKLALLPSYLELECQVLQSLLFCMHAFLTAKVASVDPAFLSSIQQT